MSLSPEKRSSWEKYRRRRFWFFVILFTYIPGMFALGYPLARLSGSDALIYAVAGAWILAFLISGIYMSSFRCPNCHRPFFFTWWFHNPFAKRCVHCGFPKWKESAAVGEDESSEFCG